jgi:hypothetical protein
MRWDKYLTGCIDQNHIVNRHAAMIRLDQSSDGIDDRRLAGTGPSQQRDQSIRRLEPGIEAKISQAMANVDGDGHSTSSRRLA